MLALELCSLLILALFRGEQLGERGSRLVDGLAECFLPLN